MYFPISQLAALGAVVCILAAAKENRVESTIGGGELCTAVEPRGFERFAECSKIKND